MGILQGDSPTPGPAMYWQPYHNEETALRVRPSAVTGASLGDDLSVHNNNNNNELTDTKMIQHHQSVLNNTNTMLEPNFYHHLQQQQQQQQQRHQLLPLQHLVKEERMKEEMTHVDDTSTCPSERTAAAQELPHETGSTTVEQQQTGLTTSNNTNTTATTAAVMCAGCGFKIVDRYYLVAVDKAWHSECLRCDECRRPLDTALSCFARQSRIYCREDYNRMFGGRKQCAKCCETLQPDELVMRGREHLFHTRCFSCHVCQTHLIKGSTFGMVGALIFCQQHYQQGSAQFNNNNQPFASSQQQPPVEGYMGHHQEPFGSPVHPFDHHVHHHHQHYGQLMAHQPSTNLLVEPMIESNKLYHHQNSPASVSPASSLKNQRVRTKRRMQPSIKSSSSDMQVSLMNEREDDSFMSVDGGGLMDTSSSSPCSSMLMGSMGGANGVHNPHQQQQQGSIQQQQKTKRLRTSFKHHQLRMLKSYFATNHNPDAKDLKQLSQKTTLSKRVLQVWFQNARAKWRRLVQKTEGGPAGSNSNNNSVNGGNSNHGGHNMSSSSSSSGSNCSGSGNETGSPVPSSSASPSHVRQLNSHGHQQPAASMMMMTSFMEHQQHQHQQQHPKMHQQHQQHHMMTTSSRMSLYDEISLSGSSSVASVGFPSPL